MELVAMDMKLRGSYIARQLSFYGVSFKIEEVKLEPAFVAVYNQAVRLVSSLSSLVVTTLSDRSFFDFLLPFLLGALPVDRSYHKPWK